MTETYPLGGKGMPLTKDILGLVILQSRSQPKGFVLPALPLQFCSFSAHTKHKYRAHKSKLHGFTSWFTGSNLVLFCSSEGQ